MRSILGQQQVDVQVAVRDDASTDGTRSTVAGFLARGAVRLTCGETPTGSAAQNYFALIRENAAETADFIALSDQDDIWYPDRLATACRRLAAASSAGYSSATLAMWPDGRSSVLTQSTRETRSDFLFGGVGQGCTFVLTADFYRRARDFLTLNQSRTGEIHYHDWTLYALARTWSLGWTFDPKPSLLYRQHDTNDTGARSSRAGWSKRLKLIRRGWYTTQLNLLATLCAAADPESDLVSAWQRIISGRRDWSRRLAIAGFCLAGGRRRIPDNAIVILAALLGWL
jgi:rhamnosyltransferase